VIDSGRSFLRLQTWQCHQVRYIVHLTLSRKERPHPIRTTHSIIINKNTAMIVSLTQICCPYDLKKERTEKRTSTVYRQMDNISYLVTLSCLYVLLIIILCDVLVDSGRSFLLNIRWTIYFSWWRYHGSVFTNRSRQQWPIGPNWRTYDMKCLPNRVVWLVWKSTCHNKTRTLQYNTILVTLSCLYVLLIIILCDVLVDSGRSFLLNIRK
jgi:hypothetical protein